MLIDDTLDFYCPHYAVHPDMMGVYYLEEFHQRLKLSMCSACWQKFRERQQHTRYWRDVGQYKASGDIR